MDYMGIIDQIIKDKNIWRNRLWFRSPKEINQEAIIFDLVDFNEVELERLLSISKLMKGKHVNTVSLVGGVFTLVIAILGLVIDATCEFSLEIYNLVLILALSFLTIFLIANRLQDNRNLKLECIQIALKELISQK